MTLADIYKRKPESYFKQNLEEYLSKRDNKLYTERDIDIPFIEHKIGILIEFDKKRETRYIESGLIPVKEFDSKSDINKEQEKIFILNPWECSLSERNIKDTRKKETDKDGNSKIKNTYILSEENKVCPTCKGTGKLACNLCDGIGQIRTNDEIISCYECDGLGLYKCDVCEGNGKVKKTLILNQELERHNIEKTFIIDELGGIQILHRRINADFDFLKKMNHQEIIRGDLAKSLQEFGIPYHINENLIISIMPFLENQNKDTKTSVEELRLYSFPISLVYAKLKGKDTELFIFGGKENTLIEKEELFKHSSDIEKELQKLTANLISPNKIGKNKKKINIAVLLSSIAGTLILAVTVFLSIYFFSIKPELTKALEVKANVTPKASLHEFQVPAECEITNTKEKVEAIINLAETYVKNDSINYAVSTYKNIANCYIKSELEVENIHIYKRIAELYIKQNRINDAKDYYSKAFVISKNNDLTPEQAFFSSLIGDIEKQFNNYKQAAKHYKVSSELYKRIGDEEKEIENLLKTAQSYIQLENTTEAYQLLENILEYARNTNNKDAKKENNPEREDN
ncbi:MAG: hypothetical protein ACOCV8_05780 [Spirochaetota bacterium]